jgi:hypothetical protein
LRVDAASWYDRNGRTVTPNAIQRWALDAAFNDNVKELFVSGGFRAGKTLFGANATVKAMMRNVEAGNASAWYAIASHRYSQLNAVTLATFASVYNAATGYPPSLRLKKNPTVIRLDGINKIVYTIFGTVVWGSGSVMEKLESLEGHEFTWLWLDESPLFHPDAIKRASERLSQRGYPVQCLLHTATPQVGRSLAAIRDTFGRLNPGNIIDERCRVAMPTTLNEANLARGYIERRRRQYSAQMLRALIYGDFVQFGSRSVHTYDDGAIIDYDFDPERPVELWCDPGAHRPAWAAVQEWKPGSDVWVIFDELALWQRDTLEQCAEIFNHPWAPNITTIVPDPSANQVRAESPGMRSNEVIIRGAFMDKYGRSPSFWYPRHAQDRLIEVGMERLRGMILSASGDRRLFVERRLTQRTYPPDNGKKPVIGIHRALSEQPADDRTGEPDRSGDWDFWSHFVDAARYGAVKHSLVRYVDSTGYAAHVERVKEQQRPVLRPGGERRSLRAGGRPVL